ncbi:hypothetical protein [Streptomyces sp. NPDC059378]|uniref:hypothetical protein n=1 Tax=Streptomyces sp. NPDC059378 TaxID=3346815 RepID=UPI003673DB58
MSTERAVPGGLVAPPDRSSDPDGSALTSENAEILQSAADERPVTVEYRQFGPVVDLAYTRWRATW